MIKHEIEKIIKKKTRLDVNYLRDTDLKQNNLFVIVTK